MATAGYGAAMELRRIDLWHVSTPRSVPVAPSWAPGWIRRRWHFDVVRLISASGHEGWASAPSFGTEREPLGPLLGEVLLGARADDLVDISERLSALRVRGVDLVWVEAAAWDLVGRARARPMGALLAEASGEAGDLPTDLPLSACSERVLGSAELRTFMAARAAEGAAAVRHTLGAERFPEALLELEGSLEALPDGCTLRVDCGRGGHLTQAGVARRWDAAAAQMAVEKARSMGLSWLESPTHESRPALWRSLRESAGPELRLVAGGALSLEALWRLLDADAATGFRVDPLRHGVLASWRFARAAREAGATVVFSAAGPGLVQALVVQLQAALDGGACSLQVGDATPAERQPVLVSPVVASGGRVPVRQGAGLGAEVDEGALYTHAERTWFGTMGLQHVQTLFRRGPRGARDDRRRRDAAAKARGEALSGDPLDILRGDSPG